MSRPADPKIYGWCPGALRPMMSGDGLVVRVRAPMGRLTQAQASGIASLSRRYGNGFLDLSARGNLQMRGVEESAHRALISELQTLDLVDRDISAEARRNILLQPFWQPDDDSAQVAMALHQALAQEDAPTLPSKFGFAVDCGPHPVLSDSASDIRIERSAHGLICRADGGPLGVATTPQKAAHCALEMARWFLQSGGVQDGRGRMKAHISRQGAPDHSHIPPLPHQPSPVPALTPAGAVVAAEFGQIDAATLARLAEIAPLRLTPWRALLIEGARDFPALDGLISDAGDPRLNIRVCTGAPGCLQALSSTRDLARSLAPMTQHRLHIAGCSKGCAHPGPCHTTLTATAQGRFTLIRDGRASDPPVARDLTPNELMTGELLNAPHL